MLSNCRMQDCDHATSVADVLGTLILSVWKPGLRLPSALRVVTWALNVVPYLPYRVLKYGPLGCIIGYARGPLFKGPY